jgi:hypothetical protein
MNIEQEKKVLELQRKMPDYRPRGFEGSARDLEKRARPTCNHCHGRGYRGKHTDGSLMPCDCVLDNKGLIRKETR